ncbi:MAG: hypothetical protein JWO70_3774 [Betaproteobacteria bacterium]|nr:hypothetical protein [Betaproteobacteria bacterium]
MQHTVLATATRTILAVFMRPAARMSPAAAAGSESPPDEPGRETPNPSLPPDMEPVVPQQDPPMPGRPGDGEPAPIIACRSCG